MGEVLFSLFVGGCLTFTGAFMNWYLGREQQKIIKMIQDNEQRPT